jgi:uncharacterized membrane protein YdjX (TVP38/TMEM64 family)
VLAALVATSGVSAEQLRETVARWGVLAPLVYWGLATLLIMAFVPVGVVSGGAGLLFGTALGFPVALLGATAAAVIAFALARRLGAAAVDEIQGEWIARARAWITERGILAVILARVSPVPSGVVNYAGGLTTLTLRTFLAGSMLGFVPRTFAYTAVGGTLDEPGSPAMLGALALLVAVLVAGVLILRRERRARAHPACSRR